MSERQADALHAVVRGRVQGVGFRFFVVDRAQALGLSGWVRNLADGTVEVTAEGERPALRALLSDLQRGPVGSQVESVAHDWTNARGSFSGFRVVG